MKKLIVVSILALSLGAIAQDKVPGPDGGGPGNRAPRAEGIPRHPMGAFWKNSDIAQKLNLTDQQKQQLETTFTNYKLKLIDQRAAVEREETKLDPLIEADTLDQGKIMSQVDALISARGQLERSMAQMGVDMRKILTTDQWKQLREIHPMGFGMGMGMGMGMGQGPMKHRAPNPPHDGPGGPGGPQAPQVEDPE